MLIYKTFLNIDNFIMHMLLNNKPKKIDREKNKYIKALMCYLQGRGNNL